MKVTLTLQSSLAAKFVEHVVAETAKSPVVEIAMPVSVTFCWLISVKVFAVLVVPHHLFCVGSSSWRECCGLDARTRERYGLRAAPGIVRKAERTRLQSQRRGREGYARCTLLPRS